MRLLLLLFCEICIPCLVILLLLTFLLLRVFFLRFSPVLLFLDLLEELRQRPFCFADELHRLGRAQVVLVRNELRDDFHII